MPDHPKGRGRATPIFYLENYYKKTDEYFSMIPFASCRLWSKICFRKFCRACRTTQNGVALPRLFSVVRHARQDFQKIFWTTAYLMQKESWKNIHPFSCNNFLNKKWAWSCLAPRDADRTSNMHLRTLLM